MRELGISEADIQGYHDYNERFDRCRRLLAQGRARHLGRATRPSRAEIEELLGGERELIDILFEASIADVLDDCVSDQRIKDALYGQGLIAAWGGPRTPGTAAIHLMHHMGELERTRRGAWGYVQGGMGMISFAIADAALEAGRRDRVRRAGRRDHPGRGRRARGRDADPRPLGPVERRPEGRAPAARRQRRSRASSSSASRDWKVRSPVLKLNAALASCRAGPPAAARPGRSPAPSTAASRSTTRRPRSRRAERGELSDRRSPRSTRRRPPTRAWRRPAGT